jgi:hypothetical protein
MPVMAQVVPPYVQADRGFLPDLAQVSSPGASPLPSGFGHPRPAPASRLSLSSAPNGSAQTSPMQSPSKAIEQVENGAGNTNATPADAPGPAEVPAYTAAAEKESDQGPVSSADDKTNSESPGGSGAAEGTAHAAGAVDVSDDLASLALDNANAKGASGTDAITPEASTRGGEAEMRADAQGLELDRASEPAAMAAARSGSLPGAAQVLPGAARPGSDDTAAHAPAAEPAPAHPSAEVQTLPTTDLQMAQTASPHHHSRRELGC